MDMTTVLLPLAIFGAAAIMSSLRVLWEYERGVVFRLGRLTRAKGPGLVFLVPFGIERMRKMDLRIIALDIPSQDTITKDNVSVKVNAVVYFRVVDPERAVVVIEDYYFATSQLAQTTLRSVIGQSELDDILTEREQINEVVRNIIDEGTDPWGIEVTSVEVKDIDLPQEMKRAMAKQAEAERERRGKVIAAEGEYQASGKLAEAARVIADHPVALQLRFLQTVVEIAAENNSTTLFPIPIDLFTPLIQKATGLPGSAFTSSQETEADATLDAGEVTAPLSRGEDAAKLAKAAKKALGIGAGVETSEDDSADPHARVPAPRPSSSEEES